MAMLGPILKLNLIKKYRRNRISYCDAHLVVAGGGQSDTNDKADVVDWKYPRQPVEEELVCVENN